MSGSILCGRLLDIVDTCLAEDLGTFKSTVQDVVDELEEMRCQCNVSSHKALVTRLLFIVTPLLPPRAHRCLPLALQQWGPHLWTCSLMAAALSALQRTSGVTRAIPCMQHNRETGSP